MATVIGKTSERIDQLLANLVTGVSISDLNQLVIVTRDGTEKNEGTIVRDSDLRDGLAHADVTAKQYADQQIAATTSTLSASISAAQTAAQNYANQKIADDVALVKSQLTTSTQAYANQRIADERTAIDLSIATNTQAAKTYADQRLATEVAAIDTRVEQVDDRVDTAMQDVLTSSSSDAQAKADAAKAAAIAAASSDATTKVDNALITAATDATTKANDARTAAISAAAIDAANKATAAQTAATTAAAADAASKAAAAEAAAKAAAATDAAEKAAAAQAAAISASSTDAAEKADAAEAAAKTAAAADAASKAATAEANAKAAAATDAATKAATAKTEAIAAAALDATNKADAARTNAVSDLKTLWGHPANTTLIDGGDIYTNTVKASSIAIADFRNYAYDGKFTNPEDSVWSGNGTIVFNTTEPNYYQIPSTNGGNSDNYAGSPFEVSTGDSFYVSYEVLAPADNTTWNSVNLHIACTNYAGLNVAWPAVSIGGPALQAAPDVWHTVTGVITVQPNSWTGRVGLAVSNNGTAGNKYRFRNVLVLKRGGGELIVDGSIFTRNIATEGLDAGTIKFGTMSGSRIEAGSLTISAVNSLQSTLDAKETPAGAQIKADAAKVGAIELQALNDNSTFSDWTGAYPAGWMSWNGSVPIKETTITNGTPNGVRMQVVGEDDQVGIMEDTHLAAMPYSEFVSVEIDAYLVSGTFQGAGVLLDYVGFTPGNQRAYLNMGELAPSPSVGKWYRFTKTLRKPTTLTGGEFFYWEQWLMANWDEFGPKSAKDIIFGKVAFRHATAAEIEAVKTPSNIATAKAEAIDTASSDATTKANNASTAAQQAIKTLWGGDPNATTIDGGRIRTNTIQANSISLADFNNYWPDRYFNLNPSDPTPLGWTVGSETPPAGGRSVLLQGRDHFTSEQPPFAMRPGEEALIQVSYKRLSGTEELVPGVWVHNANRAYTTVLAPYNNAYRIRIGTDVDLGNGWFRTTYKVGLHGDHTDAAYAILWLQINQADIGGATSFLVSDIVVMKRAGGNLIVDGAIDGKTITGALVQSRPEANRGIKIGSSALLAYDAAGALTLVVDGETGGVTLKGDLTSGSTVTGATVTGGTVQTEATANRGIKMTSTGLIAYDTQGNANLTITSAGSITMKGSLTSGSTITGATVQTEATVNRGIKMTSNGIVAYDTVGSANFVITSSGTVSMKGALTTGSTITGATVTGGTVQTLTTANRGIKLVDNKFVVYPPTATSDADATLVINGDTGAVTMKGILTSGSEIIGGTFMTSASGERIEIDNYGRGEIRFFTGSGYETSHGYIRSDAGASSYTHANGNGARAYSNMYVGSPAVTTTGGFTPLIQMFEQRYVGGGRDGEESSSISITAHTMELFAGKTNVWGDLSAGTLSDWNGRLIMPNKLIAHQSATLSIVNNVPNDDISRRVYTHTANIPAYSNLVHVNIEGRGVADANAACHWSLQVSFNGGSSYTTVIPDMLRHNHGRPALDLSAVLDAYVAIPAGATTVLFAVDCRTEAASGSWMYTGVTSINADFFG